jgi:hypothetical protein
MLPWAEKPTPLGGGEVTRLVILIELNPIGIREASQLLNFATI